MRLHKELSARTRMIQEGSVSRASHQPARMIAHRMPSMVRSGNPLLRRSPFRSTQEIQPMANQKHQVVSGVDDRAKGHDAGPAPHRDSREAVPARTANPKTAVAKSARGGSNSKVLRISFLVPREAIPRLEWLMKVKRIPTKVDLLREALNFFEDHVVEEHAKRAEQRRLAGAPPLIEPQD